MEDEQGNIIRTEKPSDPENDTETVQEEDPQPPKRMSNEPPHPALLIPGPINVDDSVLQSMSHCRYTYSSTAVMLLATETPS